MSDSNQISLGNTGLEPASMNVENFSTISAQHYSMEGEQSLTYFPGIGGMKSLLSDHLLTSQGTKSL